MSAECWGRSAPHNHANLQTPTKGDEQQEVTVHLPILSQQATAHTHVERPLGEAMPLPPNAHQHARTMRASF